MTKTISTLVLRHSPVYWQLILRPITQLLRLNLKPNPIESGAVIADHAVLKPKSVTIVGVMVEHDHGGFGANLPYVGNIRGVTDFLNQFPLPIKVVTQTAQTLAKAMDIFEPIEQKQICQGLALVCGVKLLERTTQPYFLWLSDESGANLDPMSLNDLGSRCFLYIGEKI